MPDFIKFLYIFFNIGRLGTTFALPQVFLDGIQKVVPSRPKMIFFQWPSVLCVIPTSGSLKVGPSRPLPSLMSFLVLGWILTSESFLNLISHNALKSIEARITKLFNQLFRFFYSAQTENETLFLLAKNNIYNVLYI